MFGKYNGFVSKARVSASMYFLVVIYFIVESIMLFMCPYLCGEKALIETLPQ
jgi:hypothetical protein